MKKPEYGVIMKVISYKELMDYLHEKYSIDTEKFFLWMVNYFNCNFEYSTIVNLPLIVLKEQDPLYITEEIPSDILNIISLIYSEFESKIDKENDIFTLFIDL